MSTLQPDNHAATRSPGLFDGLICRAAVPAAPLRARAPMTMESAGAEARKPRGRSPRGRLTAGLTTASVLERQRASGRVFSSGLAALDEMLPRGGLPGGSVVEICGPASCGKTAVVLAVLAEATRRGEQVAFIDEAGCFDPVSARQAGVDLDLLLVVQPPRPLQVLSVGDDLLRSGLVSVVVMGLGRPSQALATRLASRGARLLTSAVRTRALLVVLSEPWRAGEGCRGLLGPLAALRLRVRRLGAEWEADGGGSPIALTGTRAAIAIERSRQGPSGGRVEVMLDAAPTHRLSVHP